MPAADEGRAGRLVHKHELVATYWMHAGPASPDSERRWSPWSLAGRVQALQAAGFTGIGFFHDDLAHILKYEAQGATRRRRLDWVRELLEAHGLCFVELECLYSWMLPESDPRYRAELPVRELLLEAAQVLRARHVKIGNFGIPLPPHALRSAFGRLCAEFAKVGARVGMEIYLPDPNAQTLGQALEWIAGVENGGLFLDNWHLEQMPGITYADISALEARNIVGVELSDGIALGAVPTAPEDSSGFPGFRVQAANMRRIPGEGDFDVPGFISAVAATGFEGPWGNEVLSEEYRRLPMPLAYRRVFAATTALLDRTLAPARLPARKLW